MRRPPDRAQLDREAVEVQGQPVGEGDLGRPQRQVAVVGLGDHLGRLEPGAEHHLAALLVADDHGLGRQEAVAVGVVGVVVGVDDRARRAGADLGHLGEHGAVALLRRGGVDEYGGTRAVDDDAAVVDHPAAVGLHVGVHARRPALPRTASPSSHVMAPVSRRNPSTTRVLGITTAYRCHAHARVPPSAAPWWTCSVTDTSAPARITSIRWPLLLVLASLAAVAPVATDLYLPGFPEIAADLHVTPSAVQLTLTSFLVGLAFGQLVMGPMSDRLGRRGPLVVSASVCVAAGVVCAVAPNLPVLVLARLVQGFAGAGGMVIGRAIIADVVTGRAAARAFTLMITVGGVAPVLAPLVGGLLADPVGWRGMLWTVAALCAAMLLGVLLVVPETHPADVRRASGATVRDGVRTVLRTPAFRARSRCSH